MSEIDQNARECMAHYILKCLNELLETDRGFMSDLVNHKIRCGYKLATHPYVQAAKIDNDFKSGFLGVINGIIRARPDHVGYIYAIVVKGKVREFVLANNLHKAPEDYEARNRGWLKKLWIKSIFGRKD